MPKWQVLFLLILLLLLYCYHCCCCCYYHLEKKFIVVKGGTRHNTIMWLSEDPGARLPYSALYWLCDLMQVIIFILCLFFLIFEKTVFDTLRIKLFNIIKVLRIVLRIYSTY